MTVKNQILDTVIQDHKERIVLGHNDFGDIFFKEDNGMGKDVFFVCIILPPTRPSDNPAKKGEFMFEIRLVAQTEKELKGLLKKEIGGLFKILGSKSYYHEKYDELILRFGLRETLKKRLGNLGKEELYGYCASDDYNSTNPNAEIVKKALYFEEVLAFAKKFPDPNYTDIYDLAGHDTESPFVLKAYYGYGFSIPEELFGYLHLKALAIYNQSVKDFTPEMLLQFKNLNALSLDDVGSLSQEVVDTIHELPYLVDLSLTAMGKLGDARIFTQIPKNLETLKSLRYFSFSGNPLSDWGEIVKLKNLRNLTLTDCGLTSIPEEIGQLTLLEELNLDSNRITQLPEALAQLKNLKVLRLNGNPLIQLPSFIGQLKHLEVLDLSQCGLLSLPESLSDLSQLNELLLKKNPFNELPSTVLQIPKKVVKIELRNQALYDPKAKAKLDVYPKGNFKFESDFNFKLMIINELMYVDEVLLPKFNISEFAEQYKERKINIEEEGYDTIPEAEAYFRNLEIPMDLLIDIKELKPDGGDEIYGQLIPFWDGEDDQFDVKSIEDIKYLPNLKATNSMNFSKELIKQLRALKIKVAAY